MKEFELQGDISSGFRWRIKGTMEAEREVFVPLGDSSGTARIQNDGEMSKPSEKEIASDPGYNRPYIPLKRPLTDKIKFDPDYEPLLAGEREARRQLLAPPVMLPPDILKELGPTKFVDPYVARELHLQEVRDKELRDVVDTLFGKNGDWCVGLRSKAGDWLIGLCIETRRNDYASGELTRALGHAATQGDTGEAARFVEAFRAIDRLKERGPVRVAKAWALYFTLGCRVCGDPLPTRGEVLRFVQSKMALGDIDSLKRNAWRDIFTGPILSALLRGRAGRPLKTRRSRGK